MKPNKKPYEAPDIVVTRVEVESSICTGSVDIQNPKDASFGQIESQQINTDFNNGGWNDTNSNNAWTLENSGN